MGILYYVIGASGAGKDSVMGYARQTLDHSTAVFFAHRYITRPAGAGGENHVAVSPGEFSQMRHLGLFALDWQSHGLCYGIGVEILTWLERGGQVVLNGSRAYLPTARARLPHLVPVVIEVSPEILRARLTSRGRETPAEIDERVARAAEFTINDPDAIRLRNDGPLEAAGERLRQILTERRG